MNEVQDFKGQNKLISSFVTEEIIQQERAAHPSESSSEEGQRYSHSGGKERKSGGRGGHQVSLGV